MPSSTYILGMPLHAFTQFHVALSVIAILAGLIVVLGMLGSKLLNAVTALFLVTTILTRPRNRDPRVASRYLRRRPDGSRRFADSQV